MSGNVNIASSSDRRVAQEAGAKYGVPLWVLWGVYGAESTWGTNVATDPGGAVGPFAFEPATAAEYHVNRMNFKSEAYGAANLLHDLFKRYGSWEQALRHYSGGAYGVEHVKSLAQEKGVTTQGEGRVTQLHHRGGHEEGQSSVGGFMRFLISAALVLGGLALTGLGTMRAVGTRPRAVAA